MDQIVARADAGRSFTKAPEGQHQAVCADVIDLGMHEESYGGKSKGLVHKCAIVFQIDELNPETGNRFEIGKEFTVSMGEKANLRKFLGTWRGKSYTDAEAAEGTPLHKLHGVNALIQVEHKPSKSNPDRSYANIVSITPLPKMMEKIAPSNYERPDFWKEKVAKPRTEDPPPPDEYEGGFDNDDDLPF
jgi:hypothetical protein